MLGIVERYDEKTGIGVVQGSAGDVLFVADITVSRVWKPGDRVKYTEGVRAMNLQPDKSVIESESRLK
jgi:hypothetical protein